MVFIIFVFTFAKTNKEYWIRIKSEFMWIISRDLVSLLLVVGTCYTQINE